MRFFAGERISVEVGIALIANFSSGFRKKEYRKLLLAKLNPSMTYIEPPKETLEFGISSNYIGLIYDF